VVPRGTGLSSAVGRGLRRNASGRVRPLHRIAKP
jgi:hypothetical protein